MVVEWFIALLLEIETGGGRELQKHHAIRGVAAELNRLNGLARDLGDSISQFKS